MRRIARLLWCVLDNEFSGCVCISHRDGFFNCDGDSYLRGKSVPLGRRGAMWGSGDVAGGRTDAGAVEEWVCIGVRRAGRAAGGRES
jgi:hypothetical protein